MPMLKIQIFEVNPIRENCYVVSDDSKEAVIIDCGVYYEEEQQAIKNYIKDNNLKPVHLIATHGHLDHNFGNNLIFEEYGLKLEINENDEDLIKGLKEQAHNMFGLDLDFDCTHIDHYFEPKEEIAFGNHKFSIISSPGHSAGSVTFYCKEENIAFTGDTLFKGSVGRTDLPGGSQFMIIQSLRELAQLPDNTIVYPGHGEQTTIGYELASNPYMDR